MTKETRNLWHLKWSLPLAIAALLFGSVGIVQAEDAVSSVERGGRSVHVENKTGVPVTFISLTRASPGASFMHCSWTAGNMHKDLKGIPAGSSVSLYLDWCADQPMHHGRAPGHSDHIAKFTLGGGYEGAGFTITYDGNATVEAEEDGDVERIEIINNTRYTFNATARAVWQETGDNNDKGFKIIIEETSDNGEALGGGSSGGGGDDCPTRDDQGRCINPVTGAPVEDTGVPYGSSGGGDSYSGPATVNYYYTPPAQGGGYAGPAVQPGAPVAPDGAPVPGAPQVYGTPAAQGPVGSFSESASEGLMQDNYYGNETGGAWDSFLNEFGAYW